MKYNTSTVRNYCTFFSGCCSFFFLSCIRRRRGVSRSWWSRNKRKLEEVTEGLKGFSRPAGIWREFGEDFWKWEHCPDALQKAASAALIIIPSPPPPSLTPSPPLPPVSFQWPCYTWVKSRNPRPALWADAITYNLRALSHHSISLLTHTHTHTTVTTVTTNNSPWVSPCLIY